MYVLSPPPQHTPFTPKGKPLRKRYSLWAFLLPRSFQVFRVNSGSSASAYVEQWESLNWGIWVYGCWLPSSEVLCYLWHIWWPLLKLSSLWEGFWLMCGSHPCPRLEGTPITRDTVIRAVFTRGFPSLPGLLIWLDSQSAHPLFLTHWYTCEVTEKKKKKHGIRRPVFMSTFNNFLSVWPPFFSLIMHILHLSFL